MKCLDCFYALDKEHIGQELLFCEIKEQDVSVNADTCPKFLALDANICFNCFHADIDNSNSQILCRKYNKQLAGTAIACKDFESGIANICSNCYHSTPSEANDYNLVFCALQKSETQAIATCKEFIELNAAACFNCSNSKLPDNFEPDTLFCKLYAKSVLPIQQNCDKFAER